MNVRAACRWPLRSRGRLFALILAALAVALITKIILSGGISATAAPDTAATTAPPLAATVSSKPSAVPTNPDECVAQWARGPDRDACLYRTYGYTPTARPTRTATTVPTESPVVIGVVPTTADPDAASYVPEADQAAVLQVTARFVDAWYTGGSRKAWRDTVTRWADPTLADQLPTTDRDVLPGSRRIGEPAMRAFQPGLASTGVTTDVGSLAVTVIYTDSGWRVVGVTTERP